MDGVEEVKVYAVLVGGAHDGEVFVEEGLIEAKTIFRCDPYQTYTNTYTLDDLDNLVFKYTPPGTPNGK